MPRNRPANSHNPTRMPLIFGIQLAVAAIWNLTENLRYLLHLHRDGERAIGKQQAQSLSNALLESTPFPTLTNPGREELGTLMPRPQNPWAVRGEQFLDLRLGAAWPL